MMLGGGFFGYRTLKEIIEHVKNYNIFDFLFARDPNYCNIHG